MSSKPEQVTITEEAFRIDPGRWFQTSKRVEVVVVDANGIPVRVLRGSGTTVRCTSLVQ